MSNGDYLSFASNGITMLHQLVEATTVDGSGNTPLFEVRPHLLPGFAVDTPVKLKRPSIPMIVEPGSVRSQTTSQLTGRISFRAMQEVVQ